MGLPTLNAKRFKDTWITLWMNVLIQPRNYADEENNECDYGTTVLDADADGYGIGNGIQCMLYQPIGYVSNVLDCDDAFASSGWQPRGTPCRLTEVLKSCTHVPVADLLVHLAEL